MARGRMLSKSISSSKKFHSLPDDTCRLLATWIIAHLDVHGVFSADPTLVKSLVFPRRDDVTSAQVAAYLDAMECVGLIRRFDASGDAWQVWPGFHENQVGLRVDRETTDFPMPLHLLQDDGINTELSRQVAGIKPAQDRQNDCLRELKLIKGNVIKGEGELKETDGADALPPPPPCVSAIDIFEQTAGVLPKKALWGMITEAVGDNQANLELWGKIIQAWLAQGWNPDNINGMLDYFKRREIPNGNGGVGRGHVRGRNGDHRKGARPTAADIDAQARAAMEKLMKEQGQTK